MPNPIRNRPSRTPRDKRNELPEPPIADGGNAEPTEPADRKDKRVPPDDGTN
jgi:hypothetical protein